MEYRELYDENRRPLGKAIAKGEKAPEGAFIVAMGIWMVNAKKQILLIRRSPEKRFAPGKWENTSGHMQQGEAAETAIIRELREGPGIPVSRADIHFIGTTKVPPCFGDNYLVNTEVDPANGKLQPGETRDVKWVPLPELERMARDGELSPCLWPHMDCYREEFHR